MATNGSSMSDALDSRLDELFDDGTSKPSEKKRGALENLQAMILEMEWEIEDRNLNTCLIELKQLGERFRHDKVLSIYIKLLDTIGRYLKAKKAAAHPDTVSLLKSLFDSFNEALNSDMPATEKNRQAAIQVNRFKRFKSAISADSVVTKSGTGAVAVSPPPERVSLSDEMKAYIRQVVREEIARLVKRK